MAASATTLHHPAWPPGRLLRPTSVPLPQNTKHRIWARRRKLCWAWEFCMLGRDLRNVQVWTLHPAVLRFLCQHEMVNRRYMTFYDISGTVIYVMGVVMLLFMLSLICIYTCKTTFLMTYPLLAKMAQCMLRIVSNSAYLHNACLNKSLFPVVMRGRLHMTWYSQFILLFSFSYPVLLRCLSVICKSCSDTSALDVQD